jgi:hypothetical protein
MRGGTAGIFTASARKTPECGPNYRQAAMPAVEGQFD